MYVVIAYREHKTEQDLCLPPNGINSRENSKLFIVEDAEVLIQRPALFQSIQIQKWTVVNMAIFSTKI